MLSSAHALGVRTPLALWQYLTVHLDYLRCTIGAAGVPSCTMVSYYIAPPLLSDHELTAVKEFR